ncbi:MAG: DUF5106 domain-containing protein [Prevotellaceae bacterium]|jgi:hypothetical protein|nr:DUF5106 domain-containing protein [Prevotellaceae bacterium]
MRNYLSHRAAALCVLSLCLTACGSKAHSAGSDTADSTTTTTVATDTVGTNKLQMPDIPTMLTTPAERLNFLTRNYWTHYDFADTVGIKNPEYAEQAWVDYVDLLGRIPTADASPIIRSFFGEAEGNPIVYNYFAGLADKYLYDPNSPLRNEELYIPVLDQMLASNLPTGAEKIRAKDRRVMAEKNRPGRRAADFVYTVSTGEKGTLYGLSAAYTLLFLNNPGCHACRETIEALKQSPVVGHYQQNGNLRILAVYPDEDRSEWVHYLSEFPAEWVNGYDAALAIQSKNLYDLKAIPTLYLLDKDKTVLLKDATVPAIEQYLQTVAGRD